MFQTPSPVGYSHILLHWVHLSGWWGLGRQSILLHIRISSLSPILSQLLLDSIGKWLKRQEYTLLRQLLCLIGMSCQGLVYWDRLLLLTLPSTAILIGVLKSWFNVRQTPSAKKHPFLHLFISAPIEDFLWVITDITVLGSNFHRTIVWLHLYS